METVRVTTNRFVRWSGLRLGLCPDGNRWGWPQTASFGGLVYHWVVSWWKNGKGDHEQLRSVDRFSAGVVSREAVLAGDRDPRRFGWGRMFQSLWTAKSQDGVLKSQTSKRKESLGGGGGGGGIEPTLSSYQLNALPLGQTCSPTNSWLIYIYIVWRRLDLFISYTSSFAQQLQVTVESDSGSCKPSSHRSSVFDHIPKTTTGVV